MGDGGPGLYSNEFSTHMATPQISHDIWIQLLCPDGTSAYGRSCSDRRQKTDARISDMWGLTKSMPKLFAFMIK